MSPWAVRRLGDLADESGGEIRTGPFGSQLHRHDYTHSPDGIPVVMPVNMIDGRINAAGIARVTTDKSIEMSAHITHIGDVLLSRRGDIGRYCLVDALTAGALCGTGSLRVSIQRSKLMPEYLCFFLRTPLGLHQLQGKAVGSTMPNINASIVRSLEIPVPPLPDQRKVAAILSAYDDLIENNKRRINLLEEMAQRIYREWFVDFRYPGHEDVPLGDSELGPIPEGWSVAPVGSVTQVLGGGTPSKKVVEYWEPGTITWFTPTDLTSAAAMFMSESRMSISERGLAKSSARLFPAGSVMMTSRATIGVVSLSTGPAATNQGFITCLVGDLVGTYHLYFWLIDQREVVASLASGATFKEINKATFRNIPFLAGVRKVERLFEDRIEPIGGEILNLLRAQRTLRATRDLLLPRLISGQIDVTELDIAMAEAAA